MKVNTQLQRRNGMAELKFEGIQAVIFDAYGTLFDVTSAVMRLQSELDGKAEALAKLWRQKQLEYTWLRSLMGTHADFWTVTREALDYALGVIAIKDKDIADALMTQYLSLDPFEDAKPALESLRARGKRLAILSNGSPSMLEAAVRHAGFTNLFESVLSVEDVGIYKPSRRVYRLVLQKMHLADAPSAAFVSANTWDAQGAATFGFQVARIARVATPDDNIPGRPRAIISTLAELNELV
jgi:2-haloacid dehalogenase